MTAPASIAGVDHRRVELDGVRYVILREPLFEMLCERAGIGAKTSEDGAVNTGARYGQGNLLGETAAAAAHGGLVADGIGAFGKCPAGNAQSHRARADHARFCHHSQTCGRHRRGGAAAKRLLRLTSDRNSTSLFQESDNVSIEFCFLRGGPSRGACWASKRIVAEFSNTKPDEIQENHLLFEDLGWDSLDLVECTMEIEEEFDISVPDDRTERIKTVGNIVNGVLAILTPSRAGK